MSTFGREEDARWYEGRAAEERGRGRELSARRYEYLAKRTRKWLETPNPGVVVPFKRRGAHG